MHRLTYARRLLTASDADTDDTEIDSDSDVIERIVEEKERNGKRFLRVVLRGGDPQGEFRSAETLDEDVVQAYDALLEFQRTTRASARARGE